VVSVVILVRLDLVFDLVHVPVLLTPLVILPLVQSVLLALLVAGLLVSVLDLNFIAVRVPVLLVLVLLGHLVLNLLGLFLFCASVLFVLSFLIFLSLFLSLFVLLLLQFMLTFQKHYSEIFRNNAQLLFNLQTEVTSKCSCPTEHIYIAVNSFCNSVSQRCTENMGLHLVSVSQMA
jgi:hypothetical protein